MYRLIVYVIIFLIFFIYLGCKDSTSVEPQINTTPVNSVDEAVRLSTSAYTLGYHYTSEPYFKFLREINFESQSPSYDMTQITVNDFGRRQSYRLICTVRNDTVFSAEYTNLNYDTYDRVMNFDVYYSFTNTGNTYDFGVTDIIRDIQGRTEEYTADITADVNEKTVTGILTYP